MFALELFKSIELSYDWYVVFFSSSCLSVLVLRQLHELIQADFAKNHLKALKCFVEVDLLKCDRLLSQL
jgi:hypothetical protein